MAASSKDKPATSRKKISGWVLFSLFLSAWMFLLGILVGRGTAPVHFDLSKVDPDLANLEQQKNRVPQRNPAQNAGGPPTDTSITFYDTLREKEIQRGRSVDADGATESKAQRSKQPSGATGKVVSSPGPLKTAGPQPNAGSSDRQPSPSGAADLPKGYFAIQVASVTDVKAAQQMVTRLRSKNFPAFWTQAEVAGLGTRYRIRVGPYRTRADAGRVIARLKKEKLPTLLIKG